MCRRRRRKSWARSGAQLPDEPRFSHSSLNSGLVTAMTFPCSISSASRNMENMSLGTHMMTLSKGLVMNEVCDTKFLSRSAWRYSSLLDMTFGYSMIW